MNQRQIPVFRLYGGHKLLMAVRVGMADVCVQPLDALLKQRAFRAVEAQVFAHNVSHNTLVAGSGVVTQAAEVGVATLEGPLVAGDTRVVDPLGRAH